MRFRSRFLAPVAVLSTVSIFLPQAAWAAPINVSFGTMNFGADSGDRQTSAIGADVAEGFTHRYDDVFSGVDAVATLLDVVNVDSDDDSLDGADLLVDYFDEDSSSGKEIDFDLDVFGDSGIPDSEEGYATFRIDFVEANSNTSVTLENVAILVRDLDKQQFIAFAGISAYELSQSPATEISVTDSAGRFEFSEPDGDESDSSDQDFWVAVEYESVDSVTITLGARQSGGAAFGIGFTDTTWSSPPQSFEPVAPPYTVTYDSNSATSGTVPSAQTSASGTPSLDLVAPQGDLVLSGSNFCGWNTRDDGTGATYTDGDTIVLTADVTLYALWSVDPCPSSGDGEGGGGDSQGGESAPLTLAATGPASAEMGATGTVAGLLLTSGVVAILASRHLKGRRQRNLPPSLQV
jgi:hypothetical protein